MKSLSSLSVILGTALFFSLAGLPWAQVPSGADSWKEDLPRHAAGQFLVKLTSQAAERFRSAEKQNNGFLTAAVDEIPIRELRDLSREYKVSRWQRLLPAPSGKDPSGLERIYLLFCDPSVDVVRASEAFSALKEFLEYAEPDSLMRTQSSS